MKVIGLTGSIAMGKTTTASLLRRLALQRRLGCQIHDADRTVHRLLGSGGAAVAAITALFPGCLEKDGSINRHSLGSRVFGNSEALKGLEAILHPLVAADRDRFLDAQFRLGTRFAILDVPLLFETGGERQCDATLLVTAPALIQEQRALARPGMSLARLHAIRARQMPEAEKRKRADFVIWSSLGRAETLRQLSKALTMIVCGEN